jgi:hypothetical protein
MRVHSRLGVRVSVVWWSKVCVCGVMRVRVHVPSCSPSALFAAGGPAPAAGNVCLKENYKEAAQPCVPPWASNPRACLPFVPSKHPAVPDSADYARCHGLAGHRSTRWAGGRAATATPPPPSHRPALPHLALQRIVVDGAHLKRGPVKVQDGKVAEEGHLVLLQHLPNEPAVGHHRHHTLLPVGHELLD